MRVGVIGSRRWKDRRSVEELVKHFPQGTVVISGGCRGVDSWATETATHSGLEVVEHLPEMPDAGSPRWKFTKAYHNRNRKIAEDVDVLFAFVAPDRRGGTEYTIKHAMKIGVRVEVICENDPNPESFPFEFVDDEED